MKKFFYIVLLILPACGSHKTSTGEKEEIKVSPDEKKYKVSGTIYYSNPFCGGAEPSPEMLERMTRKQLYDGKVLYIMKMLPNSDQKILIDSIVSDAEGKFSVMLPAGEYCILQAAQLNRKVFDYCGKSNKGEIEAECKCLEEWWKGCYYSFTITDADITGIEFWFQRQCFLPEGIPCLIYTGPMPP